ncbi:MAG: zinc ribbon domain-containing protein [Flavobacteriales bacterium]|nr:zinc ribbon domain-containing protein [Flavobacteriales bacterium]
MKASGQCPKCQGKNIYTDDRQSKRSDRSFGVDGWTRLFVSMYVCTDCGYLEEYIDSESLSNQKKMEKLKNSWPKIS